MTTVAPAKPPVAAFPVNAERRTNPKLGTILSKWKARIIRVVKM